MRNKYSHEFEKEMICLSSRYTIKELLDLAKNKYGYDTTPHQLRQYLRRRNIIYKGYNSNKAHDMGMKIPIGTEYKKQDGMILVKVSKNKWEYKQRLIYKKYHNVELTSDDYIIFLDQDRTNFNIDNLKRISRRESSMLTNQQLFSTNPQVTETGILVSRLMIKIKDKKTKAKPSTGKRQHVKKSI